MEIIIYKYTYRKKKKKKKMMMKDTKTRERKRVRGSIYLFISERVCLFWEEKSKKGKEEEERTIFSLSIYLSLLSLTNSWIETPKYHKRFERNHI
jgi:hypothetical protein